MLFISCEGFLNAKETSSQISNSISYANAPFYTIFVDDSEGNGVIKAPAGGETQKKVSDSFTINYDPAPAYEFLYWKIIDKNNNNQEYANGEYFEIETLTNSETKCTFVRAPAAGMKLCLVPVLSERPQIISWNPKREPEGVNRDSRIEVMFDRPMALESIYYTKAEFDKLTEEKSISISNFLPEGGTVFEEHKYYGYKTAGDDTIVFKNIQIVSNDAQKENLLKYFEAPQFEDREHTSLAISVKKTNNIPNIPVNTNLQVTIDNNFYCYSGIYEKPVSLREKKPWPYWVNGNTDTTKPTVKANSFDIKIVRNQNPKTISTNSGTRTIMNYERLLKIKVEVEDFGSCPASSFDLDLYAADGTKIKTIPIYYERTQGAYSSCSDNYYYGLSNTDIPDGEKEYQFKLRFRDNSDNYATTEYGPYYIKIDTVPIAKNDTNFPTKELSCPTSEITDETKTSIIFNYRCLANDYTGGKLYYRPAKQITDPDWEDWSGVTYYVPLSSGSSEQTATISNLPYATTYELKAEFYDTADNATSFIFKKNTLPEPYSKTESAPVFNPYANRIKIPTNYKPANADKTVITGYYKQFTNRNDTTTENTLTDEQHNPDTDKNYYITPSDNITYLNKYFLTIKSINYESIIEDKYDNQKDYVNISETVFEPLVAFRGLIEFFRDPMGEIKDNKYVRKYNIYKIGMNAKGLKITYRKYEGNDLVQSGISEEIPFPVDNNNDCYIPITLDLNEHYNVELQAYFVDDENKKYYGYVIEEDDFYTNTTPSVPDFQFSTQNNCIYVDWDEVQGNFDYYIVSWEDDAHTIKEAKIPKEQTYYVIRDLVEGNYYNVNVYCYSNLTGRSDPQNMAYRKQVIGKQELSYKDDIRIMKQGNSSGTIPSNYKYEFSYNSNYKLFYETSYNTLSSTNNQYFSSYIQINPTNGPQKYYLQYYYYNFTDRKYIPVSGIFAVTKPYAELQNDSNYKFYYLKNYYYSCSLNNSSNNASVTLNWTWASNIQNGNGAPPGFMYILYREAGTQGDWIKIDNSIYSNTTMMTITGLTKGKSYYVVFSRSSFYREEDVVAVAFIKIPSANIPETVSVSTVSSDSVILSWSEVPDCDCYNIYIDKSSSANNNLITIQGIDKTETSLYIDNLSLGTYYYTVVPHFYSLDDHTVKPNQFTLSADSSYVVPPVSGVKFTPTINANGKGIVQFTRPESNSPDDYKYRVLYKTSSSNSSMWSFKEFTYDSNTDTGLIIKRVLDNLEPGTQYDLKVITIDRSSNKSSTNNEVISFYTLPEVPVVTSTTINNNTLTANWELPSGNYYKAILWFDGIPVLQFKPGDSELPTTFTFEDLQTNSNILYSFNLRFYNLDGTYSECLKNIRIP